MSTVFHITATQLSLIIGVIIPALVALVTKKVAPGWVKQLTLLLLAAVGGWFAAAASDTPYTLSTVLTAIGTTFAFSAANYFGLSEFVYKPAVTEPTANVGIGRAPAPPAQY
jgi:hypothetical protein